MDWIDLFFFLKWQLVKKQTKQNKRIVSNGNIEMHVKKIVIKKI